MSKIDKIQKHELINMVVSDKYTRLPDTNITVCSLKLKSGFSAIGYSASLNAVDYDEIIGQQISYDNALDTLWELEGYHRLAKLYEDSIIAQANTEAWDNRELGADVEYTDLAPIGDDILLHSILNEDVFFADSERWEPSVDKDGNYVPPEFGADIETAERVEMPASLKSFTGK